MRLILICLMFAGCTGKDGIPLLSAPTQPQIVYQLDLSGTLDGVPWNGIAVGNNNHSHDIKIKSKTDVNYMRVLSCHRFEQFEDVVKTGWFKSNRGFQYAYHQSPGVEDTGFCVLRLQAFTKNLDANGLPVGSAFGLMLFQNDMFSLAAENICNGQDVAGIGTSICQSMNGLIERLKFDAQVIAAAPSANASPPCLGRFIDAQTWEYTMPIGECMAVFMTTAKPHQFYIHLAYGFTKSQYRGDE